MQLLHSVLQYTSRANTHRLFGIWVEKADQEEWHVVFPRDPPKAAEVRDCNQIMISILRITDLQFPEICTVMHIPPKDDRAESEAFLCDAQEFLLGDQLATQLAIDINTCKLDFGVMLQEFGQRFDRNLGHLLVWHLLGRF